MKYLNVIAAFLLFSACGAGGNQAVGYQSQIATAEEFIKSGQYGQGYEMLNLVSASHPNSDKVQLEIADSYFRVDALLKAEEYYKSVSTSGAEIDAMIGLGRVALARNDAITAMRYFQQVVDRDPDNIKGLNGQAVAHDLARDHAAALVIYEKALAIAPGDPAVLNNYGLSLLLNGQKERSVSLLGELVQSNLESDTARHNLALAYHAVGARDEAVRLARIDLPEEDAGQMLSALSGYHGGGS
jgi:Flp pilus assembly protein TadD